MVLEKTDCWVSEGGPQRDVICRDRPSRENVKEGSQSKGRMKNRQRAGVRFLRLSISSLQGSAVEESRRRTKEAEVAFGSSSPPVFLPPCRFHIHILG